MEIVFFYIKNMEQTLAYAGAVGGLAGIAAILTVLAKFFKDKRDNQLEALTQSVMAWKGLWEASTNEIRELKMEIKELRIEIDKLKSEIDKLRTENAELKGQLKEHYKLA